MRLRDYRGRISSPIALDGLQKEVSSGVHTAQLEGYLDEARRSEFKGNKKKALSAYYDALYFLRHDEIDDATQSDHIHKLEQKIQELGGKIDPVG